MYSPYDFTTTEEREGGKFRGTIVFTGIDEDIRGSNKILGGEMGTYVRSSVLPGYAGVHIWLPGKNRESDGYPIVLTDEPTFRRVVYALNAVRDKLIAEHDREEEVCWPDGQPLKTYNEEDDMESITVDGWTVKLLKPVTLAAIIRCGNVGCDEFRREFDDFEDEMVDEDGDVLHVFDDMPFDENNIKTILAHPKWKDFLVQHGFIEVKKAEPEFKVGIGDVFVFDGVRYVLAGCDDRVVPMNLDAKCRTHWGGPYTVGNLNNITAEEFREIFDGKKDDWQSIYATKCRIKSIETDKV